MELLWDGVAVLIPNPPSARSPIHLNFPRHLIQWCNFISNWIKDLLVNMLKFKLPSSIVLPWQREGFPSYFFLIEQTYTDIIRHFFKIFFHSNFTLSPSDTISANFLPPLSPQLMKYIFNKKLHRVVWKKKKLQISHNLPPPLSDI